VGDAGADHVRHREVPHRTTDKVEVEKRNLRIKMYFDSFIDKSESKL
jgi:hypothetical protein